MQTRPHALFLAAGGLAAVLWTLPATSADAQEMHLFGDAPPETSAFRLGLEPDAGGGGVDAALADADADPAPAPASATPQRRCVLFQCETLPIAPAPKLFTTGVTIWTVAGLLGGIADGIEGPIHYGVHPFSFTRHSTLRAGICS